MFYDHKQDGNDGNNGVAVGGIVSYLARWGPSAVVCEIQTKQTKNTVAQFCRYSFF